MEQMSLLSSSILTVKELTGYLHGILESDDLLRDIWVQGEISNLSRASSGHIYFTLKDQNASIRCAMWRPNALRLITPLQDGQSVEAHGYVDIYEAGGQLQFYADTIRPAGEGLLYQEFIKLKTKLEEEGLFDPALKRPLPAFPHRIGIVTSPTGAALQDILNVLRRRFPLATVILSPTPVQGSEAPTGILAALKRVIVETPDVIILARGGGSLEDLWAFNDENVARAIAASPIPVITGIGHETDFTIADFVADLRAPTPTAAAELATPNREDLLSDVVEISAQLTLISRHIIDSLNWQMADLANRLMRNSPVRYINYQMEKLTDLTRVLTTTTCHNLEIKILNIKELDGRLSTLSPEATLKRGFALVIDQKRGRLVTHIGDVIDQMPMNIQVSDGSFHATATQE
ncbi:MAG: exodeoxyribonuclease VII large subunit [Anaerolineaceae bacterium]